MQPALYSAKTRIVCVMTDFPPGRRAFIIRHTRCLLASFRHWAGRDLLRVPGNDEAVARALYTSPMVVVSHGTGDDPILNYGNLAAQALWEMDWEALTQTPSRLTAEPEALAERTALLARVARDGYIDNYRGIRISSTGRRFMIEHAVVWNLLDDAGTHYGQAAAFSEWRYL